MLIKTMVKSCVSQKRGGRKQKGIRRLEGKERRGGGGGAARKRFFSEEAAFSKKRVDMARSLL